MINYSAFTVIITVSILAPIVGAISILAMVVFERQLDLLKSQNTELALESELRQMQYIQLNQQIQPHFFFNTLNLLLSLARLKRTEELVRSLEHFSLFFRYNHQEKGALIPIAQELQFTQHYLAIQQMRFGDRLKVTVDCPPELDTAFIIPYMLQTLVENSCKHGLEHQVGEARIAIQFSSDGQFLTLEVTDNGVPMNFEEDSIHLEHSGLGLKNVRGRLNLLFSVHGQLQLEPLPSGGTRVTSRWPLQYATAR